MEKSIVTMNVGRTGKGFSASCDLLPGWVVAFTGVFSDFEKYVKESVDFYIDCAKADRETYPAVFDGEYEINYLYLS